VTVDAPAQRPFQTGTRFSANALGAVEGDERDARVLGRERKSCGHASPPRGAPAAGRASTRRSLAARAAPREPLG